MPLPDPFLQGADLPAYNETPNGPAAFNDLYGVIGTRFTARFATTAERDDAYPSPVDGQICAVAGRIQTRTGGAWRVLGLGVVGLKRINTGTTTVSSSTFVEVTALALADVPVVSGRTYRISLGLVTYSSVSSDILGMRIEVDPGSGFASLDTFTRAANSSGALSGNRQEMTSYWTATVTANVDFRVMVQRAAGSGTITVIADANASEHLEVTDVGSV